MCVLRAPRSSPSPPDWYIITKMQDARQSPYVERAIVYLSALSCQFKPTKYHSSGAIGVLNELCFELFFQKVCENIEQTFWLAAKDVMFPLANAIRNGGLNHLCNMVGWDEKWRCTCNKVLWDLRAKMRLSKTCCLVVVILGIEASLPRVCWNWWPKRGCK